MAQYPDIRDLQMLVALAQHRHFTLAASECGISQPAFSARIRNLEEQLGVPIVRRGNKFLGFSEEGELVLKWARKILVDAEGLKQDIEEAKGSLKGNLVLGVVPTALSYSAQVAARLRVAHPDLVIRIQSLTSSQISRGLLDNSLDAGITYQEDKVVAPIQYEVVYQEHYVLLTPKNLAPRLSGFVSWSEAAALPLCLLTKDMRFRQIIDEVFALVNQYPKAVMETNAFTPALAQIANGSAATIAPEILIDTMFVDPNVVCLKLNEPSIEKNMCLATLNLEPVLPAINALRSIVTTEV